MGLKNRGEFPNVNPKKVILIAHSMYILSFHVFKGQLK